MTLQKGALSGAVERLRRRLCLGGCETVRRAIKHNRAALFGLYNLSLAEQFADVFAHRLVGRAVAGMINVMLQIIEQLVGSRIALVQVAGQSALKNFVEPIIHALIER